MATRKKAAITAGGKRATRGLSYADRMRWFLDDRFGMFIHWGLYAIPARGEWVRHNEKITVEAYEPFFREFDPDRYDPVKWAKMARAAGQKYAVMTAKHHDGFCLFDSKLTDYKATNTPAGRDLLREYADAFRAEGLKVGFYYSLLDWHHPDYPADRIHPMRDDAGYKSRKRDFSRYVDYLHGQVRELVTRYGQVDVLWFDFSYDEMSGEAWRAEELIRMVRSYQPDVIIDNRLVAGHTEIGKQSSLGDFASPEQIIPAQGILDAQGKPAAWEACITINDHWGYNRDDKNLKSPAQVIRMLVECVSKGGNLLLNVGPTARGEIQPEFEATLSAVGRWISYNGESIYGCGPTDLPKPEWGYYTARTDNPKVVYAHIIDKPVGPIGFLGLGGRVVKARLLADGSEVGISKPWNVGSNTADAFATLPRMNMPLAEDIVLELTLQ